MEADPGAARIQAVATPSSPVSIELVGTSAFCFCLSPAPRPNSPMVPAAPARDVSACRIAFGAFFPETCRHEHSNKGAARWVRGIVSEETHGCRGNGD